MPVQLGGGGKKTVGMPLSPEAESDDYAGKCIAPDLALRTYLSANPAIRTPEREFYFLSAVRDASWFASRVLRTCSFAFASDNARFCSVI